MTFREIPFSEYQNAANKLLRKHGVSEKDLLPIDPEMILRKEGLGLNTSLPLQKQFGIRGCVVKRQGRLEIYVDEYHYMNESESCHLTIGEELGHSIIHLEEIEKINSIQDWMKIVHANHQHSRFIESQARMFGCNLILPSFIFEDFLEKWVEVNVDGIQCFNNHSPDALQGNIATLLQDDLALSYWIIYFSLGRWPDRPIDKIIRRFPQLMQKKKSP